MSLPITTGMRGIVFGVNGNNPRFVQVDPAIVGDKVTCYPLGPDGVPSLAVPALDLTVGRRVWAYPEIPMANFNFSLDFTFDLIKLQFSKFSYYKGYTFKTGAGYSLTSVGIQTNVSGMVTNQYAGYTLKVQSGACAGNSAIILENDSTYLYVDPEFFYDFNEVIDFSGYNDGGRDVLRLNGGSSNGPFPSAVRKAGIFEMRTDASSNISIGGVGSGTYTNTSYLDILFPWPVSGNFNIYASGSYAYFDHVYCLTQKGLVVGDTISIEM